MRRVAGKLRPVGWSIVGFAAGRGTELMWPDKPPSYWWVIAVATALVMLFGRFCRDKALVPWWKSGKPKIKASWAWAKENKAVVYLALTVVVLASALVVSLATNDRVATALARLAEPGPDRYAPLRTRPVCENDCRNVEFRIRDCEVNAAMAGGLGSRRGRTGDMGAATEYFRGCLIDRGLSWEPCERGEPECRLLSRYSTGRGNSVPLFIGER